MTDPIKLQNIYLSHLLGAFEADTLRVKQQCQVLGGVTSVALTQDATSGRFRGFVSGGE